MASMVPARGPGAPKLTRRGAQEQGSRKQATALTAWTVSDSGQMMGYPEVIPLRSQTCKTGLADTLDLGSGRGQKTT